jgi:hypothetical protein
MIERARAADLQLSARMIGRQAADDVQAENAKRLAMV